MQKIKEGIQIISKSEFSKQCEMYKIITFLNKSLKSYGFIFGLSEDNGKYVITIYESNE